MLADIKLIADKIQFLIRFFLFLVYSLDVCRDILVSSDGSSILTWDLKSYKMRVKSICFDDGGNVEELKIIDPTLSVRLKEIYADDTLLVVVRSNKAVKVTDFL